MNEDKQNEQEQRKNDGLQAMTKQMPMDAVVKTKGCGIETNRWSTNEPKGIRNDNQNIPEKKDRG